MSLPSFPFNDRERNDPLSNEPEPEPARSPATATPPTRCAYKSSTGRQCIIKTVASEETGCCSKHHAAFLRQQVLAKERQAKVEAAAIKEQQLAEAKRAAKAALGSTSREAEDKALDALFFETVRAKGLESAVPKRGSKAIIPSDDSMGEESGDDVDFAIPESPARRDKVPSSPRGIVEEPSLQFTEQPPHLGPEHVVIRESPIPRQKAPVVRVPKRAPAKVVKPVVEPIHIAVPNIDPIPMKLIRKPEKPKNARIPERLANPVPHPLGEEFGDEEDDFEAMELSEIEAEEEQDTQVMEAQQRMACGILKQVYFFGVQHLESKAPTKFPGVAKAVRESPINAAFWDAGISEACADLGVPLDKLKSYHFLFLGNLMIFAPYLLPSAPAPKSVEDAQAAQ